MPHWSHPSIRGAMQWGLNWTKDTRGASNIAQETIGTGSCAVVMMYVCPVDTCPGHWPAMFGLTISCSQQAQAVSTAQSESQVSQRWHEALQPASARGERQRRGARGEGAREVADWAAGRAPHGEQQGRWGLSAPLRGCFPNWIHQQRPRLPERNAQVTGRLAGSECPPCGCRCDLVKQPARLHARYNITWHVYTVLLMYTGRRAALQNTTTPQAPRWARQR